MSCYFDVEDEYVEDKYMKNKCEEFYDGIIAKGISSKKKILEKYWFFEDARKTARVKKYNEKNVLYRLITGNYTKYNFSSLLCLGIISVIGIIGLFFNNLYSQVTFGSMGHYALGFQFILSMLAILIVYAIADNGISKYERTINHGRDVLRGLTFFYIIIILIIQYVLPFMFGIVYNINYEMVFVSYYVTIIVAITSIKIKMYHNEVFANMGTTTISDDDYNECQKVYNNYEGDKDNIEFLKALLGKDICDKYEKLCEGFVEKIKMCLRLKSQKEV